MVRITINLSTQACPIQSIMVQAGTEGREGIAKNCFTRILRDECSVCLGFKKACKTH